MGDADPLQRAKDAVDAKGSRMGAQSELPRDGLQAIAAAIQEVAVAFQDIAAAYKEHGTIQSELLKQLVRRPELGPADVEPAD
jgi:hypothetical protein